MGALGPRRGWCRDEQVGLGDKGASGRIWAIYCMFVAVPCQVTSCHVTSHHIISCHVTSRHDTSWGHVGSKASTVK